MSCNNIIYKDQTYSLKEFKDYVQGSPEEFKDYLNLEEKLSPEAVEAVIEEHDKQFNSPVSTEQAEIDLKTFYKPITLFSLPDGSPVLDPNMLPGKGSKIAQAIKEKYGWDTLRGIVYFDRRASTNGRSGYVILRIDREVLRQKLTPNQGTLSFDSGLAGLSEAMKEAAQTQERFDRQIDRIGQEADKISKVISRIDDEAVRTRLRDAVAFVKDPIKKSDIKNFSYLIVESAETLKHYANRLKQLRTLPTTGEQISEIDRAKILSDNFKDLIEFLSREFRFVDESNEFKKVINDLSNAKDHIETIYAAEAEELAIHGLSEYLAEDEKIALDKLSKDLQTLKEQKEKALVAGASESFVKRIDKKIENTGKRIIQLVPDKRTLDETFRGLRGDLDWITANLRSTIAMGDPIISGFARKLKEGYNKVRRALLPIREEVYDQLVKYKTTLNLRNSQSMATFYEGLYDAQDMTRTDMEGKVQTEKFYTLLSPFKESFYNEDLQYRRNIDDLKNAGAEDKEIRAAQKTYRDWLANYAERKYKDEWYERYDLLIPEAEKAREELIDEMNNILRGPNRDSISDTDFERLHELKFELKRLASNYNNDGKLKDEAGQKIAGSIQAFNKATSEMSYWEITEENRNWFNIILGKKKDQLEKGLISQDDFDKWYRLNTQRVIKQEFYKERQVLLDTVSSILSRLPKDQFGENISKLWTEVFDASRPYRDDDNILDGTEVKPEERSRVKTNEDAIEDLKRKLIRFSGLSIKEEQELGALWNSIESLSSEEIRRFVDLREKKAAYRAYIGQYVTDPEFKLLLDSFAKLAQIQKWAPTEYYKKVYNEKLHEFRKDTDPNFTEDIEDIRDLFEAQSDWFKDNHVLHFKKVFEEGESYYTEVMEPIYIWKDILPTDSNMIEENAPGFAFRTRIVKDDFLNSNHSLDIKGRVLPKRYSKSGELSSYINEKYESLKNESLTDLKAKAKWDMLQTLTAVHFQAQEKLPVWKRLGYILPGLRKQGYDRALDRGVRGTLQAFKQAFQKTQDEKDLTLGDTSQLDLSIIPVKYATPVNMDDQNLNLADAILKHRASAEEYDYLETELPLAKVISETLKTAKNDIPTSKVNEVMSRMGFKKFIKPDKQTRRSRAFDEMLRTIFYGENEIAFPQIIPGIDTNKVMNNFLGLSSLQIMVLNIPAHITNVISGEIQNVIESSANKYFSFKDYLRAKVIYAANVHKFWEDYSREGHQSRWSTFAQYFDVPQGEFLDNLGRKTNFSRIRSIKSHLMIIKGTGEHEIQVSTLIAMMENYKVKLNGNYVPLHQALETIRGEVKIKEGAEVTQQDLDKFQNRVHAVLRELNGAYSKFDKSIAEKTLLGKLGFYMRKYFIPMAYRRFETFKYDYEEQAFKEGYYRTTLHFLKDLVTLNADLVRNWDTYKKTLSAEELQNLRRVSSELLMIAILGFTILLVGGYDNDRELKGRWWYTMALYHLERAKSEAETFIPFPGLGMNEFTTLFSSPFASAATVKTAGRLLSDLDFWSPGAYFKRDYSIWKEGDLRAKADIIKLIGLNTNLITPENLVKNFELRQR